jgi:hypothetical protein
MLMNKTMPNTTVETPDWLREMETILEELNVRTHHVSFVLNQLRALSFAREDPRLQAFVHQLCTKIRALFTSRENLLVARTVVLKLKTAEFKILTRSHTSSSPPFSCEELTAIALSLRERVSLAPQQRFRLVGVCNFLNPEDILAQPALFG